MSQEQSYAGVHWPIVGGEDLQLNRPELLDVAHMEDEFRGVANIYAQKCNFDFARRIVEAGAEIVNIALAATGGDPGSVERERGIRFARGNASQIYERALDRCRVPPRDWSECFATADSAHVPDELLTMFKVVWGTFTECQGLSIKLGYEQHRS